MKIKENIQWVGKIDWDLKKFHGNELSTFRGSSYNSYLIRDEKNVLIDTVWTPFSKEFVDNLSTQIDLNKIDYIIALHAEPDHSGALAYLMEKIPGTPIYCSANGVKSLKGYYHKDWNFVPVKTGDKLNLGSREITFIEAPMLHWPDTMLCYLNGENVLFSSDVFGQHYASEFMYNDLTDHSELRWEAMKYYANIVVPFSKKVIKKVEELKAMNLPIDLICPAHGIMFRKDPHCIIEEYANWANEYKENQITILYDTMYNSTRQMAEAIAKGIASRNDGTLVKVFNCSNSDRSEIITEIFRSKAIAVGSATVNGGVLASIYEILNVVKDLGLSGKKAAAFGSYGWSPSGVKHISELLQSAGFEIVGDGLKSQWNPDENVLAQCFNFGAEFSA